ncbi:MAG: replicative DNA helicase, partial [Bacilli bacterium]
MPIRELPNNIEAEQAVLGSMFLSKTALQKACDNLNEDIFYLKKNGMIFKSIKELVDKNIPIDITTVTDELKNKNIINEVGGVEYLTEILDCVPSAANFDYYSKIIEDKAILRNLIEVSTSITTLGYEEDNEINETVEEAERRILNISKNRKTSEFKSIQDVMKSTQENLIKLSEMKGEITG